MQSLFRVWYTSRYFEVDESGDNTNRAVELRAIAAFAKFATSSIRTLNIAGNSQVNVCVNVLKRQHHPTNLMIVYI